ncbi:hypothetical protein JCM5805K_1476 [Lactococcus lactis subsp. lactis]|uniref:50S ribosomal protein L7/L12 n=1 Tax=Lactococcus lactis subsp. lactis TaxID=1360 RepID=A0A0B8R2B7_LACLL|nr:hypothetical protein JCM5805K_1476 [Lactococcus lactis subsp. lactis]
MIEAPAASSFSLTSLASDSERPSLIIVGAPSTSSLASLSPRPVIPRTSLITATFLSPADVNSTSNESLAAAAASPAPAAAATGAAAVTSNFSSIAFTSSESSRIVAFSSSATMFSMFNAILIFSY